jgi:elongation factor Ts
MTDKIVVTPLQVKELRERTGVGMAKCKEALDQAKGNMDDAIAFLRKSGMASAVKKEGRETKEGSIVAHEGKDALAIIEVNVETDFVAKNDKFLDFCKNLAQEASATKPDSLEAFMKQAYSKDPLITIDQYRSLAIQTIGENIQVRRLKLLPKKSNHSFGIYSHMSGKILSCVEVDVPSEEALAKDVAMHVAAASPEYLSPMEVPDEILKKERAIAQEQVKGKPEYILEKIIEGKLKSFFDAICLIKQKYIRDDSVSVEQYVAREAFSRGKQATIVSFTRWMVGQ